MAKMMISVELNKESALGRLARIESLASELLSEVRWAQKEIMCEEKADSDEESAQRN